MKAVFGILPRLTRDEAGVTTLGAALLASIIAVAIVGLVTVFDPNIKYKFSNLTESVNALDNELSVFGFRVALGPAIASQRSNVTSTAPNVGGDTVTILEKDSGTKRVDTGAVNDAASRENGSVTISITDLFAAVGSFGRRTINTFSAADAEPSRGFTKSVANSANATEEKTSALKKGEKSGVSSNGTRNKSGDDYFNWLEVYPWIQAKATEVVSWWELKYPQLVLWIEKRGMIFYGLLIVLIALEIVILRVVQAALLHSNRKSQLKEWHRSKNNGADQEQAHASVAIERKLDNTKEVSDTGLENDDGPLSELQVTRNELERLHAAFEQLRRTQLETQNLVGRTQAELQDSKEELAQVNAVVDQKHAELEDLREELGRARAELNQKQAEVGPKGDGQPLKIRTMPEDAQEALTKAKEEAGRALEGWIAARSEAEYARAETEQIRHDQEAARERSEQTQAELAASKEELAQVKEAKDRMQAESMRMQEELARTEEDAASLRKEKQDIHDRYRQSQNIIEKARNELVQAQKNSLQIREKQLSCQQEALKACEELIRRDYERLHSQEEGLNANLQGLEDKSRPTHGPAEAAVQNRYTRGQFVVDEEKAVPTIADEGEMAPEKVVLPDPIVEGAKNELTEYSERKANIQNPTVSQVTSRNLEPLKAALKYNSPTQDEQSAGDSQASPTHLSEIHSSSLRQAAGRRVAN